MLSKAKEKGLYGSTIKADFTGALNAIKNDYGAVISAGAFTSGHLGPEPLEPLLDIARTGALFVIGVNKAFSIKAGFEPVVQNMHARGVISDLSMVEVPMYDRAGHDHSSVKACALCYHKT